MTNFMTALLQMTLMGLMTAGGQLFIKLGMKGRARPVGLVEMVRFCLNPLILSGLFLALAAPLVYIQALKLLGLSAVYGLNGLTYLFVYALSRIVLKEEGSLLHLAGLVFIAGGVFVWSM